MTATIVHPSIERHEIHVAVCRYRKQGLVCSACTELSECAERVLARLAAAQIAEGSVMAVNGTSSETQATGRVTSVNPKGLKLDGSDEWFNVSKYSVGVVLPEKGAVVTLTLDKSGFIRSVVNADGSPVAAPTQTHSASSGPAHNAPSSQRERTITRLAVLKAAAEYSASKPQSSSGDVLKIAASWERWVLRETSPEEELVDAF